MDMALDIHVGNLMSQGYGILRGLRYELDQLETPTAVVTRGLMSEGVGAFFAGALETKKAGRIAKKATKAYLADNIRQSRQTIVTKYEERSAAWESDIIRFLQQISTSAPGLTVPGNSDKLVKRVRQADRYKKSETRVRHIIIELDAMLKEGLIYNSSLPQALPKPAHVKASQDASKLLMNLEVAIRRFVECELGKAEKDWWCCVPLAIRNNAEKKKSRSESTWPWYPPTSTNVVDYLNFSDYRRIILEENNWDLVFSGFFKERSFVEVRLGELEPIRNDIAHSRPITPLAVGKLRIFSTELMNCMKSR